MLKLRYVILAALIFFGAVSCSKQALEIRDSVSGRIYGRWLVEDGGEFAIEFIHSVNQYPVRDTFVIKRNKIWLSDFSASFNELNYIVGTVSDHLLFIGEEIISLRDLCGRNAQIIIRTRRK